MPLKLRTTSTKYLLAPVAASSLLLLSACGGNEDQEQDPSDDETQQSAETEDAPAETNDAEDSSSDQALTMEEVEQNDSADSCWATMDGSVYDLTDWIDEHPGGAERIQQLCGTDAGDAFESQHGGQEGPEEQLAEFEIGPLED